MKGFQRLVDNIYYMRLDYKDIFTTVYLVLTDEGALLLDCASSDSDVSRQIIPALQEVEGFPGRLDYVFVSHNHRDHAGGLQELLRSYPDIKIISCGSSLRESLGDKHTEAREGDILLGVLRVVEIPGHTADSAALLDTRGKTLVCGDSLQLYGIVGSGDWAANVTLPLEHRRAIDKLRAFDIDLVATAHDYRPYGQFYRGKDEISAALDSCIEPLDRIEGLILENPGLGDSEIAAIYNSVRGAPTVAVKVVAAIRRAINS